jgi:hypothetical protein
MTGARTDLRGAGGFKYAARSKSPIMVSPSEIYQEMEVSR